MRLVYTLLVTLPLLTARADVNKHHIGFLMQKERIEEAITVYTEYRTQLGRHDFEVLQQMALTLLDEGARSGDSEKQLLSIFSSGVAGIFCPIDILQAGIASASPETQLAAIHALGRLQDDRSEEVLSKAMASEFLYVRMEAAYALAIRKARTAVGQIEALMYRLPPQLRYFFPEFFALIGTSDAMLALRQLVDDPQMHVKVEAILHAARYGRDDLLPQIRAMATHTHPAEQEASAFALGKLRDSSSLPKLKKLAHSRVPQVRVAALRALCALGDLTAQRELEALALEENLFAISVLATLPGAEETLVKLTHSRSEITAVNAGIALLKLHDPRAVALLLPLLVRDGRDVGLELHYSVGHSLNAWRVVPMAKQKALKEMYDVRAVSLSIREHLLQECLELPEKEFLKIARAIFRSRQTELIPMLTALLQNLATQEAIALLQEKAKTAGAPLIRTYCSLALFRLNQEGPYGKQLRSWIRTSQTKELVRFRPVVLRDRHLEGSAFELTPEESARLLIEAYTALAERHETESIDLILEGIRSGHPKNRYLLSGLLLQAIQ